MKNADLLPGTSVRFASTSGWKSDQNTQGVLTGIVAPRPNDQHEYVRVRWDGASESVIMKRSSVTPA